MSSMFHKGHQLFLITTYIKTDNGCGSGFFFKYQWIDGKHTLFTLTNKHIVENAITISSSDIDITDCQQFLHEKHDLVAIDVTKHTQNFLNKGKLAISFDDMLDIDSPYAIQDILMIGYPNGLCSQDGHFLPIARRGITAFPPDLTFSEDGIGIVDVAIFPGSSGSPILSIHSD